MARVLGEERHTLRVQDPLSGSVITLHYRRPTTEERVAYQLSAFRLEGGERRFCLAETRLKFGREILTGFGEGDFQVREDGAGDAPGPGPASGLAGTPGAARPGPGVLSGPAGVRRLAAGRPGGVGPGLNGAFGRRGTGGAGGLAAAPGAGDVGRRAAVRPGPAAALPGRKRRLRPLGLPGLRGVPAAGSRFPLDLAPGHAPPVAAGRVSL